MVPRTSRRRKFRKNYYRKFAKVFAISAAISSISIGSSQLTSPTYGAYNNLTDLKMGISSCFIFPKTVEGYLATVLNLVEERKDGLNEILIAKAELGFNDLETEIEQIQQQDVNHLISLPDKIIFTEGLNAVNEQLESENERSNQLMIENEAKYQQLVVLKDKIQDLDGEIQHLLKTAEIQSEESAKSVGEVIKIINMIKESKERAETDCNYDEYFFPNILKELEAGRKSIEDIIDSLNNEKKAINNKFEQISLWRNQIDHKMTVLSNETDRLAAIISKNMEQIEQAEIKKKQEEEAKQKMELDKEMKPEDKEEISSEEDQETNLNDKKDEANNGESQEKQNGEVLEQKELEAEGETVINQMNEDKNSNVDEKDIKTE